MALHVPVIGVSLLMDIGWCTFGQWLHKITIKRLKLDNDTHEILP